MSWENTSIRCDGCRAYVESIMDCVSLGQVNFNGVRLTKHYHKDTCWQTGWYTGIEPKGEWPTPEGEPPASLPGRDEEPVFDHISKPAFPETEKGDPRKPGPLAEPLTELFNEIGAMMEGRHAKYGPGNIAEFGDLGILVRMGDKFARLKSGFQDFSDETVHDTLDDIIGYALIWKMWLNGDWPGSNSSGSVTMTTKES